MSLDIVYWIAPYELAKSVILKIVSVMPNEVVCQ